MVERFQQQKLASAQTPVPRQDNSMSQAAALIAQAADRQRDMIMSTAAGHIANANASFSRANAFAQQAAGSVVNMLSAGMKANKGAGDEERRRLDVALARISENDLAEQTFNDYRQKYANDPGAALAAFNSEIPNMRQAFQERYGHDERSLRELLPVHDNLERMTKARLESWAQKTQTGLLKSRLNLLPEELSVKIDNLQGGIDEQFDGFHALLVSSNDTFKVLHGSAQDEGTRNNIMLQELKLKRKLSQDFVNHLVAQTPNGEAGLAYIDRLSGMIQDAHRIGLPLSADDQKSAIGALQTARNHEEQDVLLSVKTDGDIRLLGVNRVKADIFAASAAGDTKALSQLAAQVKTNLDQLDQRIEQISQQPDSNVKKAKLLALKQEQGALITEIGMELNQQRTLVNIQNSMISMARAARGEARAIAGMARSNVMFANYLADREIRKEEKEARIKAAEAFDKQLGTFNQEWAGVTSDLRRAYALPVGEAQTKRISEIANQAVPMLNKAVRAGTITRDSYNNYLGRLESHLKNASEFQLSKPSNFYGIPLPWGGGGKVQQLKGEEKAKAAAKAQASFAQLLDSHRTEFDDLGKAYSYLNASALGKREKAVITQYLDEKLPAVLGSKKYKSLPASQKDRELSRMIRSVVDTYRRGDLK